MRPLNGEKTHPLKRGTIMAMQRIERETSLACYLVNPGIINRLLRENLAYTFQDTAVNLRRSQRIQLTGKGRAVLRDIEAGRTVNEPISREEFDGKPD
jgi:hypothetical protein